MNTPTIQAEKLHKELKEIGINAILEKSDGYKHIDIAITSAFLNIEVDGSHHNTNRDQANSDLYRTYHSYIKGYNTIRIPNSLLQDEKDIRNTARMIKKMIEEKPKTYNKNYCNKIREENKNYKVATIVTSSIAIIAIIINFL